MTGIGERWYTDTNPGWFGGQWWWVAVTAAAGVGVGLLRHLTHLPEQTPGLIADLEEQHVDARLVPGIVAVSAVSLIGGASLGPEKALGSIGGGAGSWFSERRRLNTEDSQVATLAGFAGAYGGLFSSTVIVVMMILEITRPGDNVWPRRSSRRSWPRASRSGSISPSPARCFWTSIRYPRTSSRTGSCWQAFPWACSRLSGDTSGRDCQSRGAAFRSAAVPSIVRSTLGGLVFGLVGVALPLTMFTGSDQLKTVLSDAETLGLGLVATLVIAKMLTFAVSQASGFVGGPIFPGAVHRGNGRGTGAPGDSRHAPGTDLHLLACSRAGIPGRSAFSMVLLAAFVTQVGALQTAPILIAVVTAFLATEGVKYLVASRQRARPTAGGPVVQSRDDGSG